MDKLTKYNLTTFKLLLAILLTAILATPFLLAGLLGFVAYIDFYGQGSRHGMERAARAEKSIDWKKYERQDAPGKIDLSDLRRKLRPPPAAPSR